VPSLHAAKTHVATQKHTAAARPANARGWQVRGRLTQQLISSRFITLMSGGKQAAPHVFRSAARMRATKSLTSSRNAASSVPAARNCNAACGVSETPSFPCTAVANCGPVLMMERPLLMLHTVRPVTHQCLCEGRRNLFYVLKTVGHLFEPGPSRLGGQPHRRHACQMHCSSLQALVHKPASCSQPI